MEATGEAMAFLRHLTEQMANAAKAQMRDRALLVQSDKYLPSSNSNAKLPKAADSDLRSATMEVAREATATTRGLLERMASVPDEYAGQYLTLSS